MTDVLLRTKLFVPPARAMLLARPRLLTRLNDGLRAKLTLVTAPAGFGKTTLVAGWLSQLPPDQTRVAWLSLAEADDEPVRFLRYLVTALQTAWPEVGEGVAALVQSPRLPVLETIFALLSNDLSQQSGRLLLVLDDYHAITQPAIHEAMAFWVDYLPPQVHLLLTSRADPPWPLSRWRVRGELVELRAADLRFTNEEAAAFLRQVAGLTLPQKAMATLSARTEGWVAGLQLAALSLRGRTDIIPFLDAFSGSHATILDYLTDEVLRRQSAEVRAFLIETALLDRLSAPLCQAVTQRSDSSAVLSQLYQNNLFLISLDERREWFRYHTLFREALLTQLQRTEPERMAMLHQRAAVWLAQAGLVDEALYHWLAVPDVDHAAALVEAQAWPLFEQGDILTLRGWLERLPGEVVRARPRLTVIHGLILTLIGQLEASAQLLNDLSEAETSVIPVAEMAVWQTTLARFQGDVATVNQWAELGLRHVPADRRGLRASLLSNLGMASIQAGQTETLAQALQELLALGQAGHPSTTLGALLSLAWLEMQKGQLMSAMRSFRQVMTQAETVTPRPLATLGIAMVGLGQVFYQQNYLVEAAHWLKQGLIHLQKTIEQVVVALAAGLLALVYSAQGQSESAQTALDEAETWNRQMRLNDVGFAQVLAAYQARLWLRQGQVAAAQQWATSFVGQTAPPTDPLGHLPLALARVYIASQQPEAALTLLAPWQKLAEMRQWHGQVAELWGLQALALKVQGDDAAAVSALHACLSLAEPAGMVRFFLDEGLPMAELLRQAHPSAFVTHLLAEFLPDPASTPQGLPDPLSSREVELLHLLATGASNQEIAERLVIAVPTVKKHISNILVKLDVTNRTQAVARGRVLGLLP